MAAIANRELSQFAAFLDVDGANTGTPSNIGIARSTTHVDFAINKESDNAVVNTGSLSVQIKNHL
jgi:hypothetical protein